MSLNAHDRRALDLIAEGLSASDPGLASMLSAFDRLADGEAMPGRERIQAGRQPPTGGACHAGLTALPGRCWRGMGTQRWIVLTFLAVSLLLVTLALIAGHSGAGAPCAAPAMSACGAHLPAHQQGQPVHESPG